MVSGKWLVVGGDCRSVDGPSAYSKAVEENGCITTPERNDNGQCVADEPSALRHCALCIVHCALPQDYRRLFRRSEERRACAVVERERGGLAAFEQERVPALRAVEARHGLCAVNSE